MDRQTLRDWVIRFNDQGPDGLINIPSPGLPPKLNVEVPKAPFGWDEDGFPATTGTSCASI
jgi:hypothetical protein